MHDRLGIVYLLSHSWIQSWFTSTVLGSLLIWGRNPKPLWWPRCVPPAIYSRDIIICGRTSGNGRATDVTRLYRIRTLVIALGLCVDGRHHRSPTQERGAINKGSSKIWSPKRGQKVENEWSSRLLTVLSFIKVSSIIYGRIDKVHCMGALTRNDN